MLNENILLENKQLGDSKSEITFVFLHGSTMTKEGMLPIAKEFSNYNCI